MIKLITPQKDQKIIFLREPFNIFSLIASNENENGNFTEPREIVDEIWKPSSTNRFQRLVRMTAPKNGSIVGAA